MLLVVVLWLVATGLLGLVGVRSVTGAGGLLPQAVNVMTNAQKPIKRRGLINKGIS